MPRCVYKIQNIIFIKHSNWGELDSDPPLPLDRIGVQNLVLHFAFGDGAGDFQHAVGQRRFAVVHVGNNGEVSDILHEAILSVLVRGGEFWDFARTLVRLLIG